SFTGAAQKKHNLTKTGFFNILNIKLIYKRGKILKGLKRNKTIRKTIVLRIVEINIILPF
ncbi:MAG: hypothetical protein IJ736_01200, partial [Firmicutes bacterium]|nr:hypothetical protein [Bacillota bacterium]